MTMGVVLISHVPAIVQGLQELLKPVAPDVPVTTAAGDDDGGLGADFTKIQQAIERNSAAELFVFYDMGSTKLTAELVIDNTAQKVTVYDVAMIEGAYTAAALIQAGVSRAQIDAQLAPLKIK